MNRKNALGFAILIAAIILIIFVVYPMIFKPTQLPKIPVPTEPMITPSLEK